MHINLIKITRNIKCVLLFTFTQIRFSSFLNIKKHEWDLSSKFDYSNLFPEVFRQCRCFLVLSSTRKSLKFIIYYLVMKTIHIRLNQCIIQIHCFKPCRTQRRKITFQCTWNIHTQLYAGIVLSYLIKQWIMTYRFSERWILLWVNKLFVLFSDLKNHLLYKEDANLSCRQVLFFSRNSYSLFLYLIIQFL